MRLLALASLLSIASVAFASDAAPRGKVLQAQLGGMTQKQAGASSQGFEKFMQNRAAIVAKHRAPFVSLAHRLLPAAKNALVNPTEAQADALFEQMKQANIGTSVPDDFCFARAEVAARAGERGGYAVSKINFVATGKRSLTVKTKNAADGAITWRYHVAPLVKVGNVDYVLDPSMGNQKMTVDEWKAKMHDPKGETIVTTADQMSYSTAPAATHDARAQQLASALAEVAGVRQYERLRARDLAANKH
jgi:hypothetical protein